MYNFVFLRVTRFHKFIGWCWGILGFGENGGDGLMGKRVVRKSRKLFPCCMECSLWLEPLRSIFPQRRPASCKASCGHDLRHKRRCFAHGSSFAVPSRTIRPTCRWPWSWVAIPTRFVNGGVASRGSAWMVCRICLVPVGRGLFPPEDRHRVLILATEKPAERSVPVAQWSLSELAAQLVNESPAAAMSRSTVWRILDQVAFKPHKSRYWLNSYVNRKRSSLQVLGRLGKFLAGVYSFAKQCFPYAAELPEGEARNGQFQRFWWKNGDTRWSAASLALFLTRSSHR
ncbi:hypothetical protein THTE_2119 [Thermogutta terrifontis]|uniref:Uncharacterized protein n=1 Tax=Thermogutta terrifontis TaxID=1331910 RepID=A0A286RFI7_9BACT|nr:hypothetical protein THTE_2119 [Thermogutta terrifontis]